MVEQELHYLLMLTFNRSNRAIVSAVRHSGLLPGQPKILEFLSEHDGCTQKQLGAGCALDKSTVTSLLSRMEQGGLVERQTSEEDRRVSFVCLTAAGRERAAQVRRSMAEVDARAWGGMDKADRETLLRLLARVNENLGRTEGKENEE